MSSSARHQILAVKETTYGQTPASPALKVFRNTGTTLALTKDTVESGELRPDRQVADERHGTRQIGGDISVEISDSTFKDYLEAVLCGTWAAKVAPFTATTISAASADNSLNFSANNAPAVEADDVLLIAGFVAGGNNGTARVVSRTGAKIVLSGRTLVNEAAGASVTLTCQNELLKVGVERRSFTLIRDFGDIAVSTDRYHRFTGCEFSKLDLSIAPNAMATATFGVIGQDLSLDPSAPAGATYPAATTTSPMDSFGGSLKEGGTALGIVTEITQSLENNLEARFVVGSKTTILPSIDKSMLTGQVTVYFENNDMLKKFVDEVESKIQYTLGDVAGNKLRFTYPRVKYNGGQPDVSGQPSLTLAMPFKALFDPTTGTQMYVERIPALV